MSVRRSTLHALLASAVLVAAPSAQAQEDPRKAQAEAAFGEGVKLHDAGRDREALEKYRRAYELYPTPNILFGIARLEQLLGRPLNALRSYREALGSPLLHPKNQELGRSYVAELETQVGRVDVKAPSGTILTFDGRRIVLPLERPLDVEPGSVVLEGTYGDTKYSGRAVVAAGGRVTLEMVPASSSLPPATTVSAAHVEEPAPVTSGPSFWTGRRIAGAGIVVAGAGALIGGVLFLGSSSDHDDRAAALRRDNPQGCAGASGSSAICGRLSDEVDAAGRDRALGWVFLGGGTALALGGAALFVWPSSGGAPSNGTGLRVRPRGAGLELQGTF